jgi:hypothetical protein
MALTWADFTNGESALSIRTKLNNFNNNVVTADNSNVAAINANTANIATNTANIATNTSDISDNADAIVALSASVNTNTSDIADINSTAFSFATLYGTYGTLLTYNLTTDYQDLANYPLQGSNNFTVSATNGTLVPTQTGYYQVSLFLTGFTTESSQKTATVALFEDGVALMAGSSHYKDDIGINVTFTGIFPLVAGREYKIGIKGSTTGTIGVAAKNFAMHYVGS